MNGKRKYLILFCIFFVFKNFLPAQNRKLDSALNLLKVQKNDTNKAKNLILIGRYFGQSGKYDTCIYFSKRALSLSDKLNFKPGMAASFANIAISYNEQGNYPMALDYSLKSLKIREETGDKKNTAASLNNVAIIYKDLKDFKKSFEYNNKSLKLKREISDYYGIAASLNNIAVLYRDQNKTDTALKFYTEALKIRKQINDERGIATTLNNIANIYSEQNNQKEALEFNEKSILLRQKLNDRQGLALSYNTKAKINNRLKNYKEAKRFAFKTLEIGSESGMKIEIENSNKILSEIFQNEGDYKNGLKYYKAFIAMQDSIFNEENTKKNVRIEMNYEYEKKEAVAKAEQEKKEAVTAAESKKQKIVIWSVCGILVIVISFAFFAYRSFLQKKKANIEITLQKEIIEAKQKEILDSIYYARRIQRSLLPGEKYIEKKLAQLIKNK